MIIVLWRAGLRISEARALAETDLDRQRAVLVRAGKGGRRREVGVDRWACEQLVPWLELRRTLPVGALFCVVRGPTRGRPCSPAGIRAQLHRTALAAGVRRRFAPQPRFPPEPRSGSRKPASASAAKDPNLDLGTALGIRDQRTAGSTSAKALFGCGGCSASAVLRRGPDLGLRSVRSGSPGLRGDRVG